MQKLKNALGYIRENSTELWLGLLLCLGIPYAVYLYTDYRGFIASFVAVQTAVFLLSIYKGAK